MDGERESSDRPWWWRENERLRQEMGLPEYQPARFDDDVYLYNVISILETEYDCQIQLFAINPRHPDSWQIRIDGDEVLRMQRTKTADGNTIYEMTSEEFETKLRNYLDRHE